MGFGNNQFSQFGPGQGGPPPASSLAFKKGWSCCDTLQESTKPFEIRGYLTEEKVEEQHSGYLRELLSNGIKMMTIKGIRTYLRHQIKTYKSLKRFDLKRKMVK